MPLVGVQLLLLAVGIASMRGAEPLPGAPEPPEGPASQTLPAFLTDGPTWPLPPDPLGPQLQAIANPIQPSAICAPQDNPGAPGQSAQGAAAERDEQSSRDDRPKLNVVWDNGAVMESPDKAFRLHVGGRFDFDNTWYRQSSDLPFLLQDGSDMRRARLRADGAIGENVDFVTEVNFANIQDVTNEDSTAQIGSVGLTDFYATFKQVPVLQNVRIGHFNIPIGLEHITSSNNWYYMEYSPGHDAFLQPFNYVTGIETFNTWCDDRITGVVAYERVGKNDITPFAFGSGPGKYGVTGRLTCLPFYKDEGRRLLHLGIGYSYSGTENNFYAANRPLVRAGAGSPDVPNIIYSGTYYTPNPVQIVDAELAAVIGRFALSAEYQLAFGSEIFSQFNNGVFSGPHGDVTYQGLYVEAGFFLNPDDHRAYDKKEGVWGRQAAAPCGPPGQTQSPWLFDHMPVQLICRLSYLNLASGQPVLTPSSGAGAGWENDITVGADWYINPEVHFILNYVFTQLDYVNNTSGHFQGLGCRLHLDF
jgi:phosphate-selective porin OprO and OprP